MHQFQTWLSVIASTLAALGHLWAIPRAGSNGAAAVTLLLSAASAVSVAVSALRLRLIGFPVRSAAIAVGISGSAATAAGMLALDDWTVAPWAIAVGVIGAGDRCRAALRSDRAASAQAFAHVRGTPCAMS